MPSYIKKSTLIREFRKQVSGKSESTIKKLDNVFFNTINRVFKKKPHDVKFHLTKEDTLVFNIDFDKDINVYLEYFSKSKPSTLLTISHSDDQPPLMDSGDLEACLNIMEESITT